ncbi:MAG: FAD-dependent oxidoreductase [Oscillospiraceae bacterium]|nr:FAD-dependent oxidoreductase [Oscillospiraceae bacterium]
MMEKYNLIVTGGGLTGVAAALAAAREGLSVLLIERGNCFGGAAVTGLVNPFMPFWTHDTSGGERKRKYLSGGIFREILNALSEAGALGTNEMTFDEEYLKLLLNRMIKDAGITPLFHSYATGADISGGTVNSITVANKSGNTQFAADYFIDATGDGDIAAICGFPFRMGREKDGLCQPMTLCFRLANVDMEVFERSRQSINPLYKELREQGKIKNIREDVLHFYTLTDGMVHFNSTRIIKKNPVDAFDLTDAEIEAREQVFELHNFLRERIDGFRNSRLIMTAPQIGVRESRKIDGEYVLTGKDLIACTKFDDSIAAGNYDIDIHNPEGSGTSHYYFKDGEYYTIPYRCLIPKDSKNLLVAGRCVSATHEAQASIRIMPIVCCLGEAAGTAAAVAHKGGASVKEADVTGIQNILRTKGAII